MRHTLLFILLATMVSCAKDVGNDDTGGGEPEPNTPDVALVGFNALFLLSHLHHIVPADYPSYAWVMEGVPQNMPLMPASKAGDLLAHFERNDWRASVFREIVTLKTVEPVEGDYPFDLALLAVLRQYEQRDVELILAFSKPYPSWIDAKVQSSSGGMYEELGVVADVIAEFLVRQHTKHGLDEGWMVEKLKIEPFNEFNAEISGEQRYAAFFDNAVAAKLDEYGVPYKEVLASSIISGDQWLYLDWWTNYYEAGGKGIPNIHLYPMDTEGVDMHRILSRWESVVTRLQDPASLPNQNRIVIGEIGFPRAGLGDGRAASVHAAFFETVFNSKIIQSVDRILFWQLFSDWLSIDCTDATCDPLTARETTFGYLNFRTNTPESQMATRFFPFGFQWSH